MSNPADERISVHHGDSREVLKAIPDSSVDSCVCDPPYALVSIVKRFGKSGSAPAKGDVYARASAGFMGKQWDTGETAFDPAFWCEVVRVLKPGAHVVAFSGTRTYHRLACAIEDAGFEIRDMVSWLYGSGFPKSHNQGEGRGTALKPACEPIVLARKPLDGTVAANVLVHGTGALNIDASRVPTADALGGGAETGTFSAQKGNKGWSRPWMDDEAAREAHAARVRLNVDKATALGRWPANIIHDGSEEVIEQFPAEAGAFAPVHRRNSDKTRNAYGAFKGNIDEGGSTFQGDSGSAARFFYSAKADAEDRLGSKHPTVKPVDLMAYLCRLVTPPGGVVLDPFAGTGTTGLGAMREGFRAILIEREAEYVTDIHRRLAWARGEGRLTALEAAHVDPAKAIGADLPLFSGDAA